MKEGLEGFFIKEKPALALMAVAEVQPAYASSIAKRIDSTFPHTSAILSRLEDEGLVTSRWEGRMRLVELTDRGKKVAIALAGLCEALRETGAGFVRLQKIREMARAAEGRDLALGPLRRDVERLRSSGDEALAKAADDLDGEIVGALQPS